MAAQDKPPSCLRARGRAGQDALGAAGLAPALCKSQARVRGGWPRWTSRPLACGKGGAVLRKLLASRWLPFCRKSKNRAAKLSSHTGERNEVCDGATRPARPRACGKGGAVLHKLLAGRKLTFCKKGNSRAAALTTHCRERVERATARRARGAAPRATAFSTHCRERSVSERRRDLPGAQPPGGQRAFWPVILVRREMRVPHSSWVRPAATSRPHWAI